MCVGQGLVIPKQEGSAGGNTSPAPVGLSRIPSAAVPKADIPAATKTSRIPVSVK